MTTPPAMSGAPAPEEPSFLDSLQPSGPPGKRRTWLIVLIIVLALVLVGIAGFMAIIGSAGKASNQGKSGDAAEASQSQQAEGDRNAPLEVEAGKTFTLGSHKTLAGWKVKQDTSLGDSLFNVTGRVKNISDAKSTVFIHFRFIDSSGEVLGDVQCNSADLEPGQTQALNCIPDGKYGKYQKMTAQATF